MSTTPRVTINITHHDVSNSFLHTYSEIINWKSLELLRLHSDVIREFSDRLNLNTLLSRTAIPDDVVLANKHRISPILLFAHQTLSLELVDELHKSNWIPWQIIYMFHDLNHNILTKYAKHINWNALHANNIIPEPILESFANNFNWTTLIKTQRIPAKLLIQHMDKYDINSAIMYQEVPDEVIESQIGAIDWCIFSRYQAITSDIRKKYNGLICYRCLAHNRD
jgi:hypothetical protein